jgi:hypothetical protein
VEVALDIHTTALTTRIVGLVLEEETIHVVDETRGVLKDNVAVVFLFGGVVVHDATKTN